MQCTTGHLFALLVLIVVAFLRFVVLSHSIICICETCAHATQHTHNTIVCVLFVRVYS